MNRLTKWRKGIVVYAGTFDVYGEGQPPAEVNQQGVRQLLLRLAAYEDTGLMPKDVTDMMAANGNAICEIVKLKEKLKGANGGKCDGSCGYFYHGQEVQRHLR